MAITPEQREARKKYLGSSDAPVALGLSPWRTPKELWLEKTGRLEREYEPDTDPAILRYGELVEPVLAKLAAERIGCEVIEDDEGMSVHENGILACNLDRVVVLPDGERGILECKSTNFGQEWGPESDGAEGVPVHVLAQVLHQLAVKGWKRAWVACELIVMDRKEFRLYEIEYKPGMVEKIVRQLVAWWTRHVIEGVEPEGEVGKAHSFLRYREPGKAVSVDIALFEELDKLKTKRKAIDEQIENVEAAIYDKAGDASMIYAPGWPKAIRLDHVPEKEISYTRRASIVPRWVKAQPAQDQDHPFVGAEAS